jgi:hypothetical protein
MPDYSKSKIYKITSGDLTYIGSTCEPTLARRLADHVSKYKRWKDGKNRLTTSFQLIEKGDYQITLIELCPCGSKDELTSRERYWIENMVCVNKRIEGRTKKEYREANKEAYAEQQKAWREANRDKKNEYKRAWRADRRDKGLPVI